MMRFYVCYVKPKAILGIFTAYAEKMTIAAGFVSEGERKHSEGGSLYASDHRAGEETELVVEARPFRLEPPFPSSCRAVGR